MNQDPAEKQNDIEFLIKQRYDADKKFLDLNNLPERWEQIIKSQPWDHLTGLSLHNCEISHVQFRTIMDLQIFNIKELYLQYNLIGSNGVKLLTKIDIPLLQVLYDIPLLQVLYVYGCEFEDEGVKHLIKGRWPRLRQLWIAYCDVGLDSYLSISTGCWYNIQWALLCSGRTVPGIISMMATTKWGNFSYKQITAQLNMIDNQVLSKDLDKLIRDMYGIEQSLLFQ